MYTRVAMGGWHGPCGPMANTLRPASTATLRPVSECPVRKTRINRDAPRDPLLVRVTGPSEWNGQTLEIRYQRGLQGRPNGTPLAWP